MTGRFLLTVALLAAVLPGAPIRAQTSQAESGPAKPAETTRAAPPAAETDKPASAVPVGSPATTTEQTRAKRLTAVKRWGYRLQKPDPAEIAASPFDLVVIDYSRNGVDAGRFTPEEVRRMQAKPDGGRRIVLAYMSIGEAEDYRFYWDKAWVEPAPYMRGLGANSATKPADLPTVRIPRLIAPGWLGRENERWRGNYLVRFWYDGWQEIIMHGSESYLGRILAAGFDGVYLDRVDGYYDLRTDRKYSGQWMVNFVEELASIARGKREDFLVVPQNAEELLLEPRYLAAIDGIAKEDLHYGLAGDGIRNRPERIALTARKLDIARAAGKAVFVVEYLDDLPLRHGAEAEILARGMIPYFGPRKLDALVPPLPTDPIPSPPNPFNAPAAAKSKPK